MRRRAAGIGALQKDMQRRELYQQKGAVIAKEELEKLTSQMADFKTNLEKFAEKHKSKIKKNEEFRRHFQQMCSVAGVDPLRSSNNFWAKLLGVGDYYYELAIQIVEVFLSTSHKNGGIMPVEELHQRVLASRTESTTIEDILEAVKKLQVLGNNIRESSNVIHAIPAELNSSHVDIIRVAHSAKGCVSHHSIRERLDWSDDRVAKSLNELVMEGLVWVDEQPGGETQYWFPGLKL